MEPFDQEAFDAELAALRVAADIVASRRSDLENAIRAFGGNGGWRSKHLLVVTTEHMLREMAEHGLDWADHD